VSIDLPSTTDDLAFVYDADGQRVRRSHGTDHTVYVGGVMEVDLSGSTVTESRTLYSFGGLPVAVRTHVAGETTFVFTDHLGSVTSTWNDTTDTLTLTRYFPYGGERHSSGEMPQDQRYTGQTSDATANASGGSGLLYYNARYYDPTTAQFTQPDTIVPDPATPADLNRYSYVRGNPVRFVDPSGHDLEETTEKPAGLGQWQLRRIEQLQSQISALTLEADKIAGSITKAEESGSTAPIALYRELNSALGNLNGAIAELRNITPDEWISGSPGRTARIRTAYFGTTWRARWAIRLSIGLLHIEFGSDGVGGGVGLSIPGASANLMVEGRSNVGPAMGAAGPAIESSVGGCGVFCGERSRVVPLSDPASPTDSYLYGVGVGGRWPYVVDAWWTSTLTNGSVWDPEPRTLAPLREYIDESYGSRR